MKKLLLASIASTALIAGSATAADLARPVYRRPVVVAAPLYTWTGFYVGGNVGGSWGDARTDIAGTGNTPGFFTAFPANFAFADSSTARPNGVIGGGQVGYNFQLSPRWVLGFEADIQGSGERGSSTSFDPFSTPLCFIKFVNSNMCASFGSLAGASVTGYEAKIGWFGTVRGRLAALMTDQLLLYGTGGLAYGQVELSGNTIISGAQTITNAGIVPTGTAFTTSSTKVGFSVGGGIEGKFSFALAANWTWKLEYLYLDLGSLDALTFYTTALPAGPPLSGAIATHTHFTDNIVRVGLNYKFGNYYAPVVTK